jgi:hypothetical protein
MVRVHQAYKSGSILAFSEWATSPEYIKYNEEVIHDDVKMLILTAQEKVPPRQPVVAWLKTPFFLNYKRNVIYDADPAGLGSPWADIPDVNYFLIEYGGAAAHSINEFVEDAKDSAGRRERYIAGKCVDFMKYLQDFRWKADEIYDNNGIVVLKKRKAK